MIDIVNLKLSDKYSTNGATNLTNSIGARIEATIDFIVHWEVEEFDATFSGNAIIANDGSNFITAGFKVGDTITVVTSSSDTSNDGDYEVIGISSSVLYVANTGSSSSPASFTTLVGATVSVYGTTPITKIDFYYGLVENASSPAYVSLLDGETQKYRATGLVTSGVSSGNALTPYTTNKSWVTGSTAEQALTVIDTLGTGTSYASTGYEQYLRITHVFHINPAFLEAWVNSSDAIDSSLATFFTSSNALKYVFRIVGGYSNSTEDHNTDNGNLSSFLQNGDTGFYDEYRNGGAANYELGTVTFANSVGDTVSVISSNDATDVAISITSNVGNFSSGNHYFDVYLFEIPSDVDDYTNLTTDQWTNLDVSNVYITDTDAAANDNNISSCDVSFSTTTATITFTKTATNTTDKKYLIFVNVGETATDTADSNANTVLCSFGQFAEYINTDDIIVRNSGTLINDHSSNSELRVYSDYKGWIEDDLLITDNFLVKKTIGLSDEYEVELTGLSVNVSCEHATDSSRNFILENVTYTIPETSTRGFVTYTGDPKNYKILSLGTGDATYNEYTLQHATKLRFESTVTLPTADADFTTPTQNWSIYDLPPDWSLKINIVTEYDILDGTTVHETFTNTHKIDLSIKNYNEYDNCEISGYIQTFHPTTGGSLSGKILKTVNTDVVATFYGKELFPCIYEPTSQDCVFDTVQSGSGSYSNGEGDLVNCPEYYGILELNPFNGTEFNIAKISTLWDTETTSPWIGSVATNKAELVAYPYAATPYIQVRATIDYTKLTTTLPSYTISARLGKVAGTICQVSIQTKWTTVDTSYTDSIFSGLVVDDLLVFNTGVEKVVQGATLVGTTLTINNPLAGILKICCAKSKLSGTTNGSGEFTDASLVGLTEDDFIGFLATNGREFTTTNTFAFNSGTGTISGLPAGVGIDISFHTSLISDTLAAAGTYTDPLLSGLVGQDVLIFGASYEKVSEGSTIFGSTITFTSAVTGKLKVIKVNQ